MTQVSIIIPTLNDREALQCLLADLAQQKNARFEVVVCDGGSTDGTVEAIERAAPDLACQLVLSEKGRGRQLNAGAAAAKGDLLVFLHADSRLPSCYAIADSQRELEQAWERAGHRRIAGHLSLVFQTQTPKGLAWTFYEAKARTNRALTIHGDQSFWIDRSFFEACGRFEPQLPVLEDTRFAEVVRGRGEWLLLSSEIKTSGRRFETEGFKQRQTLNALIVNFDQIGWQTFFEQAPDLYRSQPQNRVLDLWPFWQMIHRQLAQLPFTQRMRLWRQTALFINRQAWQVGFFLDVRVRVRQGQKTPDGSPGPVTRWVDRWWHRLSDHIFGHAVGTIATMTWFYLLYARFSLHNKLTSQ